MQRIALRRPHLMLPDIRHNDSIFRRRRTDRINDLKMRQMLRIAAELLFEQCMGIRRARLFLQPEPVDFRAPFRIFPRLHQFIQPPECIL